MNKTILKWAGSKVGIMEQLRPYLPKTKRLVEPFAGSCAVMMNTDYEQYLIADINADLINMYLCAQAVPEKLTLKSEMLFNYGNSESVYKELRKKFNRDQKNMPWCDIAALFLYLNRHCFNGLCRYSRLTGFNVPFGHYKKPYFPGDEIIFFWREAQKAQFHTMQWQKTLGMVVPGDGVYCDPPYMGTNFTQYHTDGFTDADNEALAFALKDLNDIQGNPVTVSNSLAAKELYADLGFTIHEIEAPRTIAAKGNRKKALEIIAVLGGC